MVLQGKVFLLGNSMGSGVALQLVAKYPDLYDGVLDVCGGKESTMMYESSKAFAEMSDAQIIAEHGKLGLPVLLIIQFCTRRPDCTIGGFPDFPHG